MSAAAPRRDARSLRRSWFVVATPCALVRASMRSFVGPSAASNALSMASETAPMLAELEAMASLIDPVVPSRAFPRSRTLLAAPLSELPTESAEDKEASKAEEPDPSRPWVASSVSAKPRMVWAVDVSVSELFCTAVSRLAATSAILSSSR